MLHFIDGMRQAEIAETLNLSTSKVNRLITQGRKLGMVKIAIESPYQRLVELERRLQESARLASAIVAPTVSGSPDTTLHQVGRAAANQLLEISARRRRDRDHRRQGGERRGREFAAGARAST